jgi:hypothetical protein
MATYACKYGSVDLPKKHHKTTEKHPKMNWILHKHLNKHRNNEQMWNLCFYVYLFIINQKYWRVNIQRAITQLVIYSCRIKYIYMYRFRSSRPQDKSPTFQVNSPPFSGQVAPKTRQLAHSPGPLQGSPHKVKTGRLDFSLSWLKGEVRENLGDFRKSIQILMFLSPLPHVPLPFTKTNNDLKRMQLTSLE